MRRTISILLALVIVLCAFGSPAWADFYHYPACPQYELGLNRPPIVKQLILTDGDYLDGVELRLDGVPVGVQWDADSSFLYYQPEAPLAPGPHRVELIVRVGSGDPQSYYDPLRESFTFTIAPGAVAVLPGPDAESRFALGYVNIHRASAGLPRLSPEDALEAAADAHARHVAAVPTADAHVEQPGPSTFTGVSPGDRSSYFGYYQPTYEVVAYEGKAETAIEGWLATPYHRLPLIRPANRLFGYGVAVEGERRVNVINCGPDWPVRKSGASDGTGAESGGTAAPGYVHWPYPGQTGVPTSWPGLEDPDPFRLYPGVDGPVGYTISLTIPEADRPLTLASARLTNASGTEVSCMVFSPDNDQLLTDSAALIPYEPLEPLTGYTARFAGEAGSLGPFFAEWSFTTGAGAIEIGPSYSCSWSVRGERVGVEFEGLRVRPGVAVFLDGLPVRDALVQSRAGVSFLVPAGFAGGPAVLTLVSPDGFEQDLHLDSSLPPASASAGNAWSEVAPPHVFVDEALRHQDGGVMVPAASLAAAGAVPEVALLPGRTHWTLQGHTVTLTLGSLWAYVDGSRLALPLPPRQLAGETHVPMEALRALLAAVYRFPDLAGHWAAEDVGRLAGLGIVSGLGDGTFRPEARLSRAALVKMVVLAAGLAPAPGDNGGFVDTAGHWVAEQGYIGRAVAAGMVRPEEYPDGRFEPDREITRQEIAVMLVRAIGLEEKATTAGTAPAGFADTDTWSRPGHVAVAIREGIVRGYLESDGSLTFRAAGLATRAEAAVMIIRMLDWRGQ